LFFDSGLSASCPRAANPSSPTSNNPSRAPSFMLASIPCGRRQSKAVGVQALAGCAPEGLYLTRISASPARPKRIAHQFIGGASVWLGDESRQGRKNSAVPGGTRPSTDAVPTDESVGYSLSPCRAGRRCMKGAAGMVYIPVNESQLTNLRLPEARETV